jgi:hypothetical protein
MRAIQPHRASGIRLRTGGLLVAAALIVLAVVPTASQAAACTPPVVNAVACENTLPGAPPSSWQIDNAGDETIQGFATSMSVNKGDPIAFKIKSATSNYRIDILRLGYYNGDGARLIASNLTPTGTSTQPACQTFSDSGLLDCGNWAVSRSWTVPSTAVSGVYIAHLVRNDTGGDSHITFVVRDDASHSDVVLQTSDQTWQAYNRYGGNNLYRCETVCPPGEPGGYKAAYKVSYNRPLQTETLSSLFGGSEYSMIRFVEASGYDVSYMSGVDTHRRGALLQNHKLFVSSGHDEYWSALQRGNVESARDAGVNLAFFSGNEMFWKTRFEPSAAGTSTQDRTLVSYKDTHFSAQQDPVEWTGTWRDSRFTTAADGVTPENALTGQSFVVNTGTSDITVPYAYRQLRMWRNTAVASLGPGQSLTLSPSTLGYEWDEDVDNGFRPAGQFRLSSTTVTGLEVFTDYGTNTKLGGTATHNLVMYRAPSGARVFGAGTVQWAWGLDDENPAGNPANRTMQQATLNLFADMGATPYALLPGLVSATATTDSTAPTATIAAPPATMADGSQITITGTAADTGGGVVAGVEVSTDGGSTWHPATGTTNWSYSWTAHGAPSTTIRVRATDDSGNLGTPGAGVAVGVSCPCSLWANHIVPPAPDSGDTNPVEVGVKFKPDRFGTITGIRFYKSAANTGTHTGSLWTESGQRLAQATFTGETASGWQTVTFANPVEVMPDTTYVASYHAPNGHYAATSEYFYRSPAPGPNGGAIADSPPLHAVRNTGSTSNGVYAYSANSSFPASTYGAANYWVDVRFTPIPVPGAATNVTAVEGGRTSANVAWTAPSSGGQPTSYKVTPYIGSAAQTPRTVTGSPPATGTTITGLTSGTTYRFTVQAVNPTGTGPESAQSNAVTPQTPVVPAAPTGVAAQPASQSARVTWTAPAGDGDSAITGYAVTPYIGAAAQTPVQAGAAATSATITGLTNGTSYTFRVTATNGVGTSPASAASNAATPQATIFDFATPATVDSGDPNGVELGVKFRADFGGSVTGIRFYKASTNTGTHTGNLWTAAGTLLASATFTNETTSGWQTVTFSSPVNVSAGTTYVASYHAPSGHYSVTGSGLASATANPPLEALANSTSSNGVYAYGAGGFPTGTWGAANYWVDVLFAPAPPPGQISSVVAAAGQTSASVDWSSPSSGGPVTYYEITPYIGSTPQTAKQKTVSGSPPATNTTISGLTAGTAYTFTVRPGNPTGAGPESAKSNAVTPFAPTAPSTPDGLSAQADSTAAILNWNEPNDGGSSITSYTVTPFAGSTAQTPVVVGGSAPRARITGLTNGTSYTFRVAATNAAGTGSASPASNAATPMASIFESATPATADSGDTSSVVLGAKFTSSVAGSITGVRFYKSAANTGTHVGAMWSAGGTLLAQANFTQETPSGWQAVTFGTPVDIAANTAYVVSYLAPNGHYSVNGGAFSSAVSNPPLQALANSEGANGVYRYSATSLFPSSSFNASNYWIDVLFVPAA